MAERDDDIDEIGYWSEIKLAIIREYAQAYSTIMAARTKPPLHHIYIDAFAGAGVHRSRASGEVVLGSSTSVFLVKPPFAEYHFIDLDKSNTRELEAQIRARAEDYDSGRVFVYNDDCNEILLSSVFPRARWENYARALCLLDPYGLHLDWRVIHTAGQMKSVDMFLNFPVMDMNMNILWHDPEKVEPKQKQRMTRFWGDESWRQAAYTTEGDLFGFESKTSNDAVAGAFQQRLKNAAGFSYVPKPMPMRNSRGAVVYYLFFASQKPVASNIVTSIFGKYEGRS